MFQTRFEFSSHHLHKASCPGRLHTDIWRRLCFPQLVRQSQRTGLGHADCFHETKVTQYNQASMLAIFSLLGKHLGHTSSAWVPSLQEESTHTWVTLLSIRPVGLSMCLYPCPSSSRRASGPTPCSISLPMACSAEYRNIEGHLPCRTHIACDNDWGYVACLRVVTCMWWPMFPRTSC